MYVCMYVCMYIWASWIYKFYMGKLDESPLPQGQKYLGGASSTNEFISMEEYCLCQAKSYRAHVSDNLLQMALDGKSKWPLYTEISMGYCQSSSPKFILAETVWFPGHVPKLACCILRALHDRLPTTARLRQFHIVDKDTCTLCDTGVETNSHFFF